MSADEVDVQPSQTGDGYLQADGTISGEPWTQYITREILADLPDHLLPDARLHAR